MNCPSRHLLGDGLSRHLLGDGLSRHLLGDGLSRHLLGDGPYCLAAALLAIALYP